MNQIRKVLNLEGSYYYHKHLQILNVFLPVSLTNREIDILSEFLSLDPSIIEDDRFNTLARKRVKKKLDISNANLSNNLNSMVKKGYLKRSTVTGKLTINPLVLPQKGEQIYMFKLTKLNGGDKS
jgi:DNA-binding MarR family transcriptional regulator